MNSFSSTIATSLNNWDSKRCQTPSQHIRKEGWTETFGNKDEESERNSHWQHEESEKDSDISLRLYQFRPSFQEQLVLRITKTPHLVFNSSYACTETTGALPYLLDLNSKAMIGKRNPGDINGASSIVSYLMKSKVWHEKLDREQENNSHLFTCMIESKLNVYVRLLRYGDSVLWNDVYREQSISANLQPNAEAKGPLRFFNPISSFQAWSERVVCLQKLCFSNDHLFTETEVNVDAVLKEAKKCYQTLDNAIESGRGYLLGTGHLTLVDTALFQHLTESMGDIHLVRILAEYKHLISFFQTTYETYFGKSFLANKAWVSNNNNVNNANQFNRIPMDHKIGKTSKFSDEYKAAIQIMQSIAIHCFDLKEVLTNTSIEREREDKEMRSESKAGEVLKRVRMGGELHEMKDDSENGENKMKEEMKNRLMKLKRQDELWISSVVGVTVLGFLFAASNVTD